MALLFRSTRSLTLLFGGCPETFDSVLRQQRSWHSPLAIIDGSGGCADVITARMRQVYLWLRLVAMFRSFWTMFNGWQLGKCPSRGTADAPLEEMQTAAWIATAASTRPNLQAELDEVASASNVRVLSAATVCIDLRTLV